MAKNKSVSLDEAIRAERQTRGLGDAKKTKHSREPVQSPEVPEHLRALLASICLDEISRPHMLDAVIAGADGEISLRTRLLITARDIYRDLPSPRRGKRGQPRQDVRREAALAMSMVGNGLTTLNGAALAVAETYGYASPEAAAKAIRRTLNDAGLDSIQKTCP